MKKWLLKYNSEMMENSKDQNLYFTINGESILRKIPNEVEDCYRFSNYLIDSNKKRLKTIIRIFAFVLRFVNKLKSKLRSRKIKSQIQSSKNILLTEEEIKASEQHLVKKATLEVKHCLKSNQFEKISSEKDGIFYYNGKIPLTENVNAACEMSSITKDLSSSTFCVPVIYKHFPLANSVINEVHRHSKIAKHSGIEIIRRM